MRVINYDDVKIDPRQRVQFNGEIKRLTQLVCDQYSLADKFSAKIAISNQLPLIYFLLDKELKDKKILDLGCGSNTPTIEFNESSLRKYEPWLCRALLYLQAEPIGIDFGNLEDELFEHYQGELSLPNSLAQIPDQSIDLINMSSLIGSRHSSNHGIYIDTLMGNLQKQAQRVLKPNGIFLSTNINQSYLIS